MLLFIASIVMLIIGLIKPMIFARFLKELATRKGVSAIFGISIIVFFILFAVTTDTDTTPTANNAQQQNEQKMTGEAIDYEMVREEDASVKALGNKLLSEYTTQEIEALPIAKRIRYRIVVSPEIKENQVRPTVDKIVSDISSSDNDIDAIVLFLYSDKELINGAYDVATATWAPGGKVGNITPEIARSNNRAGYSISLTIKPDLHEYLIGASAIRR